MPNLVNYTPIPVSALMSQITQYKYNPSAIQRVILDNLFQYTQGQADVVDPTNPFVFLLEASCVNTAAAMQESLINLNKQYPSLAQTFDDLYLHMSDLDYLNIFSSPSSTDFTWMINLTQLLGGLIDSPSQQCKKAVIPRNTMFTVNGLVFSISYPIEIRQYYNKTIEIIYDTTIVSPLQELSTNNINYSVIADSAGTQWLSFTIPVLQFNLNTASFPIQASSILQQSIPYTNNYYYTRAYYQNSSSNGQWIEMETTYTEQVYDPLTPTLAISVDATNSLLNIFLPPIYVDSGLVSGTLRVDFYTTNGQITVNLNNYALSAFSTNLYSTDPVNDLTEYTTVLPSINYYTYSAELVQGGSNGLSFTALREQVINNTMGPRNIPITNNQIADQANLLGFNIVKNVDYITNRIFQATSLLPAPINPTLITPASLSMDTWLTTLSELQSSSQIVNNTTQSTIMSNTLFVENNGILSICSEAETIALNNAPALSLIDTVNNSNFLYNPFYYVLDYSDVEFNLRAYDLDSPTVGLINFLYQNQSLQLSVNTGNIQIAKTTTGYQITITTASGQFYQNLNDSYVQVQLAFIPEGETNYAYTNGVLVGKTAANERIFQFNLVTNYFLDSNNNISIVNFNMFNNNYIDVMCPLSGIFNIIYTTTSIPVGYTKSKLDSILGKFLLPPNAAGITQEQVNVTLGLPLENLWTRSLVNNIGNSYQTYPENIPATYANNVYAVDPVTNSIFTVDTATNTVTYTLLHAAGSPILDANGNPTYLHMAGDPVLDANGNPVLNTSVNVQYSCDLLLVDGKYYFATDPAYISYKTELRSVLDTWITQTLAGLQGDLLEITEVYFYPQKSATTISAMTDNQTTVSLAAAQSFTVNLYVSSSVYNNSTLRDQLNLNTIQTINTALQNSLVSISNIEEQLASVYGSSVISFNVSGLGGSNNYTAVTIPNNNESLSLKKILSIQEDSTITVTEDVTINYIEFNNN